MKLSLKYKHFSAEKWQLNTRVQGTEKPIWGEENRSQKGVKKNWIKMNNFGFLSSWRMNEQHRNNKQQLQRKHRL